MPTDSVVRARIDPDIKARATQALEALGLSVSDAIRLLLVRIAEERSACRLQTGSPIPSPPRR